MQQIKWKYGHSFRFKWNLRSSSTTEIFSHFSYAYEYILLRWILVFTDVCKRFSLMFELISLWLINVFYFTHVCKRLFNNYNLYGSSYLSASRTLVQWLSQKQWINISQIERRVNFTCSIFIYGCALRQCLHTEMELTIEVWSGITICE